MKITVRDVIEFLLVPMVGYGVYSMDKIKDNIGTLNTNVATIVEKTNNYDKKFSEIKADSDKTKSDMELLKDRVMTLELQRR